MPQVRILVSYPGDPYPSGAVVELEAREASQLVTAGRAEYIRESTVETTAREAPEATVIRRGRRGGRR